MTYINDITKDHSCDLHTNTILLGALLSAGTTAYLSWKGMGCGV